MNHSRSLAAPIVATLFMLMPLLYVGSYYCLVDTDRINAKDLRYRVYPELAGQVYWPIELADRRLRPEAWEDPLIKLITSTIDTSSEWVDSPPSLP
jgi:hypothetical protein